MHGHAIDLVTKWKFWIIPQTVERSCAWRYAHYNARYDDASRDATFNRIAPYLAALFPHDTQLQIYAKHGGGLNAVIEANDRLRVPAETFIYLDKLSQYEEGMRQIEQQIDKQVEVLA